MNATATTTRDYFLLIAHVLTVIIAGAALLYGVSQISLAPLERSAAVMVIFFFIGSSWAMVQRSSIRWLPNLLASVGISIILVIGYSFLSTAPPSLFIAGGLAFLVPTMILRSWRLYKSIPRTENKVWMASDKDADWGDIISLNTINLTLKVRRKYFSVQEQSFPRIGAKRMSIGKLFHQFLYEQNYNNANNVETVDEHGKAYGWKFYSITMAGLKRYLDPDAPLMVNRIHENSVIHAMRVRIRE